MLVYNNYDYSRNKADASSSPLLLVMYRQNAEMHYMSTGCCCFIVKVNFCNAEIREV
jgi:hypothetical protein